MLDFKSLLTFVEVSRRLSFVDAARALGVPPSTVTTRIKALEADLGVRLFNRSTRKTGLTHEGRDFAIHCIRALDEIELGKEKLVGARETSGTVRISLPSAFPKAEFAAHVAAFRAIYPSISIEVIFEDRMIDFIADGVDLALRGRAPGSGDLFARKVASTPIILAMPNGTQVWEDLPLLKPLDETKSDVPSSQGVFTKSLEFALELVIAGQACAYLPLAVCDTAISNGKIVTTTGPYEPQELLELYVVYHDKKFQPRRVSLFKDFLVDRLDA